MRSARESNKNGPERSSTVSLLELHTFFEGQGHCLGSHIKRVVDFLVSVVVL
jgi:hypothetical protein